MLAAEDELLRLSVTGQDGRAVVGLAGELDATSAPVLRSCVEGIFAAGPVEIVFDLRELQFLDSSGLTELVTAHRSAQTVGGSVSLRQPQRSVRKVLEICGLARVIPIDDRA